MGWKGLERNKLDYILTDLLPVEISELFSFSQFYNFLLEKGKQKELNNLISTMRKNKAEGKQMFVSNWSTRPLKYRILKGNGTMREMSVIQPFSAINLYLFIECCQKEILNYFEKNHIFSIRYHRKCTDLYYKARFGKSIQYFHSQEQHSGKRVIQQTANYYRIFPFESINSFTGSRAWRMCNFKYKYYAKLDYKACFDSIYTRAFSWIIERNVNDAKDANNSNLFITIDRILQNINGRSSNGIVVGPEFSRMIAEILLQHIDNETLMSLKKEGVTYNKNYVVFRYVDDIFIFAEQPQILEDIISKYRTIGEKYLLRINDLKLVKGTTPCLPKEWLEKTRQLSDIIGNFFFQGKKAEYDSLPEGKKFLVKTEFIFVDKIKDDVAALIKQNADDGRTIVSFLLSTLLNYISKKKNGYMLFGEQKSALNRAMLLLDMALYIYAYYPSFDQTRKIISIITYMDKEINFKSDEKAKDRLRKVISRYNFIFRSGNIFDLCDWFPFLLKYGISLDSKTENALIHEAEEGNNPIIWANLLLYSQYYKPFFDELLKKVETITEKQISKITDKQPMMQVEFWYVLIFHNCPYISYPLRNSINGIISKLKPSSSSQNTPSEKVVKLIFDFLEQVSPESGNKPKESLFDWNGISNFGSQVTYRTYQRTIFKRYRKNTYWLHTSLD